MISIEPRSRVSDGGGGESAQLAWQLRAGANYRLNYPRRRCLYIYSEETIGQSGGGGEERLCAGASAKKKPK